jgi:hypothetical protein
MITVTRPTAEIRIITDMQALAESIRLGNRILELDQANAGTESEASEIRAERERTAGELKALMERIEGKTLVVTLRGLNASRWAQITLKHSKTVQNRIVKDLPAIASEAAPLMLEAARWANGERAEMTPDELTALIESMTDSQIGDLMRAVQELNTPVTEIPKELTRLI